MLCDVISAGTAFMVRVFLLEECYWDSRLLLGLKPCHMCDSIACLSGVHSHLPLTQ
jgi:hypothetical protein